MGEGGGGRESRSPNRDPQSSGCLWCRRENIKRYSRYALPSLVLGWEVRSASTGTHVSTVCQCCARHTRSFVCALRVPVSRTRPHQHTRAHYPDVTCETPRKQGSAKPKNLRLRGQSRCSRGCFKRTFFVRASQLWVSKHHFQSIYCGCRLGEILPMRRLEHLS